MTANEFASYTFDAANRITGITQSLAASLVTTTTTGAGTATSTISSTSYYQSPINWAISYDNRNRITGFRLEYIWLPTEDQNALPIGLYRNGKFFAVHSDQLNTPRKITDETNKTVWQWPYSAFGDNKPTGILKATVNPNNAYTQDPTANARLQATTPAITFNLRMPGQYFDFETGLFYNYFRSYDSKTGRYTQNDPIGLDGGLNRFGYVGGNALSYTDPLGLEKLILLSPNDINYPAAAAAHDIPGRLTIYAHGNPNKVDGKNAAELAEYLRRSNTWKPGMPITLDACRTGEGDSNIAQDLARYLATPVTAPNSRTLTFGANDLGPWHSLNIPGTERTIPYWPGKWNTFSAPSGK